MAALVGMVVVACVIAAVVPNHRAHEAVPATVPAAALPSDTLLMTRFRPEPAGFQTARSGVPAAPPEYAVFAAAEMSERMYELPR